MLSRVGRKNGAGAFGDRFDQQDLAIEKFRRFATDVSIFIFLLGKNVHCLPLLKVPFTMPVAEKCACDCCSSSKKGR